MVTGKSTIGDIRYYRYISILILAALIISGGMLLWLNTIAGGEIIRRKLGETAALGLQLFFWGALGAAIASSLYLARDKEDNEIESTKPNPDPCLLRYPTNIDVHLYCHRIITSACLAVVGGVLLYAGLGYFDVPANLPNPKHKAFFILFSFLVGLYQGNFMGFLNKRFQKILEKSNDKDSNKTGEG